MASSWIKQLSSERTSSERVREQSLSGESHVEHLADVLLRETEAISASQLFLAVKVIHARNITRVILNFTTACTYRHTFCLTSAIRVRSPMNFQTALNKRPRAHRQWNSPFCFLKLCPHLGFYISALSYIEVFSNV